jgi:hypothetical protein
MSDMGFACCSPYLNAVSQFAITNNIGKAKLYILGQESFFSILDTIILDAWLSRIDTFHARISGLARF